MKKTVPVLSDSELIESLKNRKDNGIRLIYSSYKTEFIYFIRGKFQVNANEADEIFQASLVTLMENCISGKLTELTSTLKTYFFSIGRYKCLDYLKRKSRNNPFSFEQFVQIDDEDEERTSKEEFESRLELITSILKDLGEPCYPLLKLFYFEKRSWEEISGIMGYKDDHSAKNMKYKCMKKIKQIINQKLNKIDE